MASITSSEAVQVDPTGATGYSKTSRRQYQSCDQCRKSRRACDAGILRVVNFPLGHGDGYDLPLSTCEACSNCARTSKKCTFDWLRSLPLQGLPKGVKRKLELTGFPDNVVAPNEATSGPTLRFPDSNGPTVPSEYVPSLDDRRPEDATQKPKVVPVEYTDTTSNPNVSRTISDLPRFQTVSFDGARTRAVQPTKLAAGSTSTLRSEEILNERSSVHGRHLYGTASSSASTDSAESRDTGSKSLLSRDATSMTSDSGGDNESPTTYFQKPARSATRHEKDHLDKGSVDRSSSSSTFSRRHSSGSAHSSNGRLQHSNPLSPHQVRFADGAMKTMIATGLLRIYHDSFENSLSCWVTERNCPYESELQDLLGQRRPESLGEEAAFRLSDNRIFSRVSRLDSAFSRLRGSELSPSETRAASKALNAAIMAFASQWSHSSHNAFWQSKEGLSQMKGWQAQAKNIFPATSRPTDSMLPGECELMIQKTLWHEARTAIQASAELDSFKVILAYMIFALTQRPINQTSPSTSPGEAAFVRQDSNDAPGGDEISAQYADPVMDAMVAEEWDPFYTADLEALASPPIYLESAVRNLFSWRRKVERYRRMRSKFQRKSAHSSMPAIALKDQQTFNILFWLAVMCDTTSAAISKRPLVIADEDCAMIRDKLGSISLDGSGLDSSLSDEDPALMFMEEQQEIEAEDLWGNYLLGFKWAGPRATQPRWPCSFDEAALVLQEAIPVKVLMFRKVGQLQTLAYRRSAPSNLEKCIEEALEVYQHWNSTYGPFMTDCVKAHNNLPPHVQSWYVILDGHWHYGCLLLADTISQIDKERKTMKAQRHLRTTCGLIAELRKENALAIARIAHASLSEHGPSVPNNSEFHFACNGSAILTEPWTDILVRAMGSACKVFINWLSSWNNPAHHMHDWVVANNVYDDLYAQAEACIQGMSLLGRKSDAANFTAEVFWNRLSQVCSTHAHQGATEPIKAEKVSPKHRARSY